MFPFLSLFSKVIHKKSKYYLMQFRILYNSTRKKYLMLALLHFLPLILGFLSLSLSLWHWDPTSYLRVLLWHLNVIIDMKFLVSVSGMYLFPPLGFLTCTLLTIVPVKELLLTTYPDIDRYVCFLGKGSLKLTLTKQNGIYYKSIRRS
jgi:hypothetical protein